MGVPIVYRKSSEQNIASYSFYDLTTGTGYKTFYAATFVSGAAVVYNMISDTFAAHTAYTGIDGASNLDLDFDLEITNNQTLGGQAYIDVPMVLSKGTPGGGTANQTISATLYKVSNGVETQLGQTASIAVPFVMAGGGDYVNGHFSATMNIPITILKKDDKLRLNILWMAIGSGYTMYQFHDPANRTNTFFGITVTDTNLQALIPFRIDL